MLIVAACVLFWFKRILVNEQRQICLLALGTIVFTFCKYALSRGSNGDISGRTAWKNLLESTHREESCAPQHSLLVNWHRLWFQNSVDLPLGHTNVVQNWQMEFLIIKFPLCGSISMQINSLYIETTTGLIYCKVKPSFTRFWTIFLNGKIPVGIPRLSFTWDPRNRVSFWTASSIAIYDRICTVPFKRVAQVKNSFVQNFVRTRVYGVLRSP